MTVAAKAQFEKVKSETAQALGDQQLKQQKQEQDDAFRHEQLRQKAIFDQQKVELERAKIHAQASVNDQGQAFDPVAAAKVGADLHKAHLDAAMQERELQAKLVIEQQKIAQQREAAALQAQTAQVAARNNQGGGS
jgi:hypothetical protein